MTATRQMRPELETLEAREVPAIVFASYSDGTWAYNAETEIWRKISDFQPRAMDEGADGLLYASYTNGTFLYSYANDNWSQLTTVSTTVLSAPDEGAALYASFETGTFRHKGNVWLKTTVSQATTLAGVDDQEYYGVFHNGTYRWEAGDWSKISNHKALAMDAVADGTLFASFSDGTWKYDNGWSLFNGSVATIIDAVSDDNVYFTSATGTWHSDDGDLDKLTNHQASALAYDEAALIASFTNLGGTWEYVSGLNWDKFETSKASKLAR